MGTENFKIKDKNNRRRFGSHITSTQIFQNYIFPEIKAHLEKFIWVDLFAGEGNLILPVLNFISLDKREDFFKNQIFLFDVQEQMVKKCIENAQGYNISSNLARKNIQLRDNLKDFPKILLNQNLPVYHITNPPYLYLGYIMKHKSTQKYVELFKGHNEGYQDLYQIAMMNDLRNGIDRLIYIVPTNFLFGASVSNKFRRDFLPHYIVDKVIIFETQIFEFTGTNICITFLKKKDKPKNDILSFWGVKVKQGNKIFKKKYSLNPKYNYRAGSEFNEFLDNYRAREPLDISYYLLKKDVLSNQGSFKIQAIDANQYVNNKYKTIILSVNKKLKGKIENNILYVKTVDSGSYEARVGLGLIKEDFNVSTIFVSGNTYRTHPIPLFFNPIISFELQLLLYKYFSYVLEYFRKETDSEFLTTYKYSQAPYTRKYLGLTQTRKLIETFPYSSLQSQDIVNLKRYISNDEFTKLTDLLIEIKERQK